MTMEEHIEQLDQEVKIVNNKVDNTLEVLASMNEKLKKLEVIEQGIFGNEKLEYPGIIKTIASQQVKIRFLEDKIEAIEKVNKEQDIILNARKNVNGRYWEWLKIGISTLIQLVVWWLILHGNISPDAGISTPNTGK